MNALATTFLLVNAIALLALPLRWAPLPLLVGACYMTLGQGFELGPFNFPVIRLLIAVGLLRALLSGEGLAGGITSLDRAVVLWASWALLSSSFHENIGATLVNRLGLVYNACGIYFLLRVFCRSESDVVDLCRIIAVLLIPLAVAMSLEHSSGRNWFHVFGGVHEFSEVRKGTVRAQGPFAHSILAGSVGAACIPLMICLWRHHRAMTLAGLAACLAMVYASASSGPVLSAAFAAGALAFWPLRRHARAVKLLALVAYGLIELLMNAPAYYLLARVDVTGSSTSWHRAELIDAALRHFSDWWIVGTDYTRHWMPYGVDWSGNHVDVTNYYLQMGIYGGLPLLLLFLTILARAFGYVGQHVTPEQTQPNDPLEQILMWALGAALFAHAATFMSVSYFDQSVVFLYVTLAAICAVHAAPTASARAANEKLARPERADALLLVSRR